MSFSKKLEKLQFILKLKKQGIAQTTRRIDSMKSTLQSFKLSKLKFMKKIDSLPDGHRAKKGGNLLSRQSFVDNIAGKGSLDKDNKRLMAGANVALDFNLHREHGFKKLKKLRKKQAASIVKIEKDIKRIKFIRKNGRIIPIKVKK